MALIVNSRLPTHLIFGAKSRVDTVPILYISPTVVIAGSPKCLAPVLSLSINAMLS